VFDRLKDLTAEIAELARLQIKAVKDAAFLEWNSVESAAYDERRRKLRALYAERETFSEC
jgi:hypothetical protein